ncbi:secretory lipase [Nocardia mexicana]|uniref:Secretory lipase n=1 Tax=Nocardia mexicana TaxID=279262 RepID=A0A370GMM7_9NOCA|nr:secretory lipase [Nocardia mexicana]
MSALTAVLATLAAAPVATAETSGSPGQLVSVTELAPEATLPGSGDARRLVHWSTGAGERPALNSAAVYLPPGEPPAGGWPMVVWAHGTVGLADHCAYSIAGPALRERDWGYLDAWLRQGYAIVATDYVGLGTPGPHPKDNGLVAAHSVVDAATAAVRAFPGVLSNRWVVVGQSQGGAAALWAAREATRRGTETDYRGAVATGVPGLLENAVLALGPHVPPVPVPADTTALALYSLSGLRTSFPQLDIDSYLTDAGRFWVNHAEQVCESELAAEFAAAPVVLGDMFAKPLAALPDAPRLLNEHMGIPVTGYDRPVFIGQGWFDTQSPAPGTLAVAGLMRANNQALTLRTYPADHSGTLQPSLADSIPFVRRILPPGRP